MGEATYYLKARYESQEQAKAAVEKITTFRQQMDQAADFWQSQRHTEPEGFWPVFAATYPEVYAYLTKYATPSETLYGDVSHPWVGSFDCNNSLAGLLDAGTLDDLESARVDGDDPYLVKLYAMVWHFADWEPFAAWIEAETGAQIATWISDEYVDYFDCITI